MISALVGSLQPALPVIMALSAVYLHLGKKPMETALFCIISVAFAGKICEIICICRLNQGIIKTKSMF